MSATVLQPARILSCAYRAYPRPALKPKGDKRS